MPKRLQKELVALSLQKYKLGREYFADPEKILMEEVIQWISECYFVI